MMMRSLSRPLALSALLALHWAGAQTSSSAAVTASPTLQEAITLAYRQGPDVLNAQTALTNAQTTLTAAKADPSALTLDLTTDQQAYDLAVVTLPATRLSVMQNVVNAYLTLYETQQNIALLGAQANLDAKSVQVAQAKLQARSGTSLDVATAQNTLNTTQQNLANAQAQLSVNSAALAKLFGQSSADLRPKAPPAPPALSTTLNTLSQGLAARLVTTVQASQAVALAQLNVKLSDNDYTPRLTLNSAKTKLSTAQIDLANSQKAAVNSLTAAYRSAQDSFSRIPIAQKGVQNAQTTVNQNQVRFKSGIISAVEVQTSQVALQSAQYSLTQAQDNYWKALAALSVAAGTDVTGLVKGAGQ